VNSRAGAPQLLTGHVDLEIGKAKTQPFPQFPCGNGQITGFREDRPSPGNGHYYHILQISRKSPRNLQRISWPWITRLQVQGPAAATKC
jgi:hypothetical protein